MTDNVFVNRDKSKVVPAGSVEAKWQMPRAEAVKLGLLKSGEKAPQERREPFNGPLSGTPQRRRTPKKTGQRAQT